METPYFPTANNKSINDTVYTRYKSAKLIKKEEEMEKQKKIDYSVVIPLKNESANIAPMHKELCSVLSSLGSYEVIYVNDGSTDSSLAELKKLHHATIIDLNRNYGQAIAFDAGFKLAKGEIIISMDGDMQNDPHDIPALLKKLKDENLDIVAGWRRHRKDKKGITLLSKTGRLLRKYLINDPVHDTGCALRVYRKEAIKSLDLWGDMHRYILALLKWKGFKIGEIEVNHRPRTNGKTKYGYMKALRGFIDLVYIWFIQKFSNRPLHMFGSLGLLSFFIGTVSTLFSFYQRIFSSLSLNRNGWFFLGLFMILGGIVFFSFGIVIDLLIRTNLNTSHFERRYYVRDVFVN